MIRLERTQAIGLSMAAAGAVAFSGKAIVAKLMYRLGADAISTVGLRMSLALPLFLAMAWWTSRQAQGQTPLNRRQWAQVAVLGFFGYYLASTLDFLGLQYISASLERAILYLNPTMVLLLSAWWLGQRVRALQWAAMGVAYLGVAVVWLHDWDMVAQGSKALWLGSLLVLGSALSYAIYLVGSGRLLRVMGSSRLVAHASVVACALCMVQWAVCHGATDGRVGSLAGLPAAVYGWSMVNALVCTVVPIWLLMQAIQRIGPAMAAQVGMVGPLSTLWMAAWWLGEPVTGTLLVGTAAILGGIVLLGWAGSGAGAQVSPAPVTPSGPR